MCVSEWEREREIEREGTRANWILRWGRQGEAEEAEWSGVESGGGGCRRLLVWKMGAHRQRCERRSPCLLLHISSRETATATTTEGPAQITAWSHLQDNYLMSQCRQKLVLACSWHRPVLKYSLSAAFTPNTGPMNLVSKKMDCLLCIKKSKIMALHSCTETKSKPP